MAYYAQRNYQQHLGYGDQPMAAVGCLLFAICNRLQRFGITADPLVLNEWFKAHGVYLADAADHGADILAWDSILKYAGQLRIVSIGMGPLPPDPNAIVKFHYRSIQHPTLPNGQPNMIDHFCAVDRIVDGQVYIADSYDGLVKSPVGYAPYGKPVAWAVYGPKVVDAIAAPAKPAAPLGALPPLRTDTYVVNKVLKGYQTSGQAMQCINSNSTVPPGRYNIYNHWGGAMNVTRQIGVPGWWINLADNVIEQPAPAPPAPAAPPPPPAPVIAPPQPPNWRTSYIAKQAIYEAKAAMVVKDLEGRMPDVPLDQDEQVPLAGTFTGPDGVLYGRTMLSTFPNLRKDPAKQALGPFWYGIPMSNLRPEPAVVTASIDTATRAATNTATVRDQLIIAVAKMTGLLERYGLLATTNKKEKI